MQINRLFEIVYLLLRCESVSAAELARRFEVTPRTIYRDIETLSGAGIPVYAARGKGGGFRLLPEFMLNRSWFSAGEQQEILAAVQSLSAAHLPEAQGALHKLAGLFRQEPLPWVAVDFSDWCQHSTHMVELIKTAILQRRVIHFIYYNASNQRTERSAEPQQLWFKHRSWYLRAYCLQKDAQRLFKLTRMREVACTDIPCTHPPDIEPPQPPDSPPYEMTTMHLRVAPTAAFRVYDEFDDSQITPQSDGSYLIEVDVAEGDWLYSYLLSFGSSAVVLAPEHIARKLREQIAQLHKLYEVI